MTAPLPNESLKLTTARIAPAAHESPTLRLRSLTLALARHTHRTSATFLVRRTFHLPSRRAFVLSGDILSGVLRAGMLIDVQLNESVTMPTPVRAVEAVDVNRAAGHAEVGLVLECEDEVARVMFAGLFEAGEVLTLHHPEAAG